MQLTNQTYLYTRPRLLLCLDNVGSTLAYHAPCQGLLKKEFHLVFKWQKKIIFSIYFEDLNTFITKDETRICRGTTYHHLVSTASLDRGPIFTISTWYFRVLFVIYFMILVLYRHSIRHVVGSILWTLLVNWTPGGTGMVRHG
jgi:hypothetical protein